MGKWLRLTGPPWIATSNTTAEWWTALDDGLARGQSQSRRAVQQDLMMLARCAAGRAEAPVVRLTFQKKAGEELSKLPPNLATQNIVTDDSKLRDACRHIKQRHAPLK